MAPAKLTHLDEKGKARMVDITGKQVTSRRASARALVRMKPATLAAIAAGGMAKGDVLSAARIAGIMAAKRTHELIPLCHPLAISSVAVDFSADETRSMVEVKATVAVEGKTGVEMEALTAASVAALTIYDMCKAMDRDMVIDGLALIEKSGGKSGYFRRGES